MEHMYPIDGQLPTQVIFRQFIGLRDRLHTLLEFNHTLCCSYLPGTCVYYSPDNLIGSFLENCRCLSHLIKDMELLIPLVIIDKSFMNKNTEKNNLRETGVEEVNAVETKVDTGVEEVNAVETKVDTGVEEVNAVETKVDSGVEEVNAVETKVDTGVEEVNAVETKVDSGVEEVNAVETKVDTGVEEVNAVGTKVDTGVEEVPTVETKVDCETGVEEVNAVETKVDSGTNVGIGPTVDKKTFKDAIMGKAVVNNGNTKKITVESNVKNSPPKKSRDVNTNNNLVYKGPTYPVAKDKIYCYKCRTLGILGHPHIFEFDPSIHKEELHRFNNVSSQFDGAWYTECPNAVDEKNKRFSDVYKGDSYPRWGDVVCCSYCEFRKCGFRQTHTFSYLPYDETTGMGEHKGILRKFNNKNPQLNGAWFMMCNDAYADFRSG